MATRPTTRSMTRVKKIVPVAEDDPIKDLIMEHDLQSIYLGGTKGGPYEPRWLFRGRITGTSICIVKEPDLWRARIMQTGNENPSTYLYRAPKEIKQFDSVMGSMVFQHKYKETFMSVIAPVLIWLKCNK